MRPYFSLREEEYVSMLTVNEYVVVYRRLIFDENCFFLEVIYANVECC